eukprot:352421-Chlamydomonas_euryale.AAC.4
MHRQGIPSASCPGERVAGALTWQAATHGRCCRRPCCNTRPIGAALRAGAVVEIPLPPGRHIPCLSGGCTCHGRGSPPAWPPCDMHKPVERPPSEARVVPDEPWDSKDSRISRPARVGSISLLAEPPACRMSKKVSWLPARCIR